MVLVFSNADGEEINVFLKNYNCLCKNRQKIQIYYSELDFPMSYIIKIINNNATTKKITQALNKYIILGPHWVRPHKLNTHHASFAHHLIAL